MIPIAALAKRKKERERRQHEPHSGAKGAMPAGKEQPVSNVGIAAAAVVMGLTAWLEATFGKQAGENRILVGGILLALLLMFSIKIADQWEKAVLLRMGRFRGLRGPGPFLVIPVIDSVKKFVDQRVRVTDVTAESALTRDTVPVNVDAIVFWVVWDAQKAVLEVERFFDAIALSAQTALRESIGRHQLAEMITERESLGRELQRILDEKTNSWGITVQSVEIRDVKIPPELEDAMSRQAQAERERQARIILGTAEVEIASKFSEASRLYLNNQTALHLRAMNMLYEAIKEKGSMVIVPSSAVETMGLGGMLGTTAIGSGNGGVK